MRLLSLSPISPVERWLLIQSLKGVLVINAEPLSKDELYALFLSVLELQGFTAIEIDGVVRIVHRKNAYIGDSNKTGR